MTMERIHYTAWVDCMMLGSGMTEEEAVEMAVATVRDQGGIGPDPHQWADEDELRENLDISREVWTPETCWQGLMGNQFPADFVEHAIDEGYCSVRQALMDYVDSLVGYTRQEKDAIFALLMEYMARHGC